MNRYWLLVLVPTIMLSGLVVGLAVSEEENFPQEVDQTDVPMQDYMSQPRLTNSHRDGQYGDCTLNIDYDEFNFSNTTTTVTMNCNARYGGGAGGGEFEGMEHLSLYRPHDEIPYPHDYLDWEVTGMESCSFHAQNNVWINDDAPNTITVVMNCWWQNEAKIDLETVAEVPSLTPEFLANHTSHAIHGIVTGIEAQPVEFDETGTPTIFTDVRIAVFDDLKGDYDEAFMVIRVQGGETSEYRSTVKGAPIFKMGETVLIFVNDKDPADIYGDNYHVEGLQNGKYAILGSGLAVNQDAARVTTLDELKALIQATLTD